MSITTKKDYAHTNSGYAELWNDEFEAAKEDFKKFWKQSERVIDKFLDSTSDADRIESKLNLYHANITTLRSMLYGRIPKVEVDRRYADQDDDIARVSSNILQRMLNTDIEEAGEDYSAVLRNVLDDRLIIGMGCARLKYDFDTETEINAAQYDDDGEETEPSSEIDHISEEWVDTIYLHWRDVLWSPCRTWKELRWRAYRCYLTKDEVIERFGEDAAKSLEFKKDAIAREDKEESFTDAWERTEIWEIWCKETRKVYWHQIGKDKILDSKTDPLDLDGFFPEPPSLFANLTTSKLMPKADFLIAQDLYRSIDELETRIDILTGALKVIGVYDKTAEGVKRMLQEGVENDLIPVDNWAMFAEKGGLKGVVDWLPIEQVANVLTELGNQLDKKINLLYQVTGMSDILRGASVQGASATEQSIKAKFASVRVQALQDEFARFATDLQRIKAEIISKHFQPETIVKSSNIMTNAIDSQYIQPAVELIKNPSFSQWKIMIRPESMAMVDYAQLKQDRTEYINALGLFLQSSAPIVEFAPQATNLLLELLKWGLAGFKGSNQIEGVIDQVISDLKKNPPKPKDDGQAAKAQLELQALQAKHQGDMQNLQMKGQQSQQNHQLKMQEMQENHRMEMMKLRMEAQNAQAELSAKLQEIIASAKADIALQRAEFVYRDREPKNAT